MDQAIQQMEVKETQQARCFVYIRQDAL